MDANENINDVRRRDFHKDRYQFVVNLLKDCSGLSVLDAACGTGYGSDILKQLNPKKIVGVDSDDGTIKYANKKYANNVCHFRVADVTDLSGLNDNYFDVVASFETIEHLEQPIAFLEEIKGVMKTNGTLILSTPNKWGPTKDHMFDYNYDLLKRHLSKFFTIERIFVQNSGCMDIWVNRGAPKRIVEVKPDNIEEAECFIAVCKNRC